MRVPRRPYFFFEIVMLALLVLAVAAAVSVGVHLDDVNLMDAVQAVVLSGVASCALVEAGKRLLPFRARYNRRETGAWISDRAVRAFYDRKADAELNARHTLSHAFEAQASLDQALQAATIRRANAVYRSSLLRRVRIVGQATVSAYNLPAEQFVAQVAIATDRLLRFERRDAWVSLLLTLSRRERDLEDSLRSTEDWGSWAADEVAFALDQLQNQLATRWRFRVQLASVALSGAVAAISLLTTEATSAGAYVLAAILFGGFVAWIVRDATASLERFRR